MKTLISTILAAAALAVPSAALAHHSHHGHQLDRTRSGIFAVGTGTATGGTFKSRALGSGTYTVAVAASGAATTTRFGSCQAATGTVTLTSTGTTAGTLAGSVSGKLCTPTAAGAKVKSLFFGKLTVTAATGSAASVSGGKGFAGLLTKADGTTRLLVAARAQSTRFHR